MNRRTLLMRSAIAAAASCWPQLAHAAELDSPVLGNIFTQGQAPSFRLRASAGSAHWRVEDFFGNEVASGDTALSGGTAAIRPDIRALGHFKLQVTLGRAAAPQVETALAILPSPDVPSANSPFGVVTHFAKDWPADIIPLIGKCGISRIRDEQPWRKVEKDPSQYQFPPRLSGYMSALAAEKIDPLIVLAFSNPLYDNDKTPFDDAGRAGYAAYARAVAGRYRGQVAAVEVWNEYSGSFCDGPCRSDRPAYYAAMLKEAYKSLKAENPSLVVAGGAAVPIPLDYFDGLFRHGALDAMDAVVIHPYRKFPEGVEEKIAGLRQMMQRYGAVKPIWATEFGDTADMHKNRDDVARYLVRMSTLLLAGGVERIYWYLLKDFEEFSGMGLLRSESDPAGRYVPAPAYAAYATLIKQLGGARFVRRESSDPDLRIYLFSKNGHELRVAWSAQGTQTYDLPGAVQQIDMMGNARTNTRQVRLDTNPVYLLRPAG
ncbi:MAG TPA: glycosyl hydrolase [Rhizomicrobium sp.]|nr:glycosyl hydrolase [Rhizomicrobium sp.]